MSTAVITIDDETDEVEVWVETSPNDPDTGTLDASATTEITVSADNGPWTVSFGSPANTYGVISENPYGTTATVTLSESGGVYTVSVS
jgi:hypothetical protein